jgi:hypothetical protein
MSETIEEEYKKLDDALSMIDTLKNGWLLYISNI